MVNIITFSPNLLTSSECWYLKARNVVALLFIIDNNTCEEIRYVKEVQSCSIEVEVMFGLM